ncbi:hypothetical protein EX227_01045 [Providencia rettgeri]|nr:MULTISPECIES: hypothetical protein [Providencia]HCI95418.1 hypothetical protein [Providencia sp.]EJD6410575.1 hypothetical protein [Providencia rettgeri]EJD6498775.1 hypothetical protein [Providencia rettgeri]EJD6507425.1 hypothetical protein [Providencia rettgeri]EJD6584739.1 hypothetical protein [Providencia rettgeri]
MRTSPFFLHHITRPCTIKQGNVSELVLQLRRIHNHQNIFPAPQKPTSVEINLGSLNSHPLKNNQKKLEQTPEYKKLVSEARKEVQIAFTEQEWKKAYLIRQSYTANGGIFSCAQQLANKSRLNVIGIKGEYISTSADNRQQQALFRPQNKLLRIISKLGNLLLSK